MSAAITPTTPMTAATLPVLQVLALRASNALSKPLLLVRVGIDRRLSHGRVAELMGLVPALAAVRIHVSLRAVVVETLLVGL